MGFDDLLFKRGYLVTDSDPGLWDERWRAFVLDSWEREHVGGLSVYHDPLVGFHQHIGGGVEVALLGTAIDPVNGYAEEGRIVERLHSAFLVSREDFYGALDALTGRFVILVTSPGSSFAVHDAAGLYALFYDADSRQTLVSSHASLIALLTGRQVSTAAREFMATGEFQKARRHLPGARTPYEGIRMLTPNTLLDLSDRTIERFFPREPLETGRITDGLVEELAGLFAASVDLLSENHALALSLTGGTDSRLSLAAAAAHKDDICCFTFVEDETHLLDAELAARLCDRLGVAHTVYRVNADTCGEDLEEYLQVWRLGAAGVRADSQGRISKVLYEQYPSSRLHVKSNISEVVRGAIRRDKKVFLPNSIRPATLARLYGIRPEDPFVAEAFREYVEVADFDRSRTLNYDIYDLFHWEYRMGTWQCLNVMDFDTSQDTVMLYNNRRILEKMLGVPFSDMMRDRVHKRLMEALWPEVLDVPFAKDFKPHARAVAKTFLKEVKYHLEKTLPS